MATFGDLVKEGLMNHEGHEEKRKSERSFFRQSRLRAIRVLRGRNQFCHSAQSYRQPGGSGRL